MRPIPFTDIFPLKVCGIYEHTYTYIHTYIHELCLWCKSGKHRYAFNEENYDERMEMNLIFPWKLVSWSGQHRWASLSANKTFAFAPNQNWRYSPVGIAIKRPWTNIHPGCISLLCAAISKWYSPHWVHFTSNRWAISSTTEINSISRKFIISLLTEIRRWYWEADELNMNYLSLNNVMGKVQH